MITFSDQGKAELLKAFIAAQSEMDGAKKTANNPAFKSKYADLAAVCDAVMEALTKHKIGVIQSPSFDDAGLHLQTMFVHEAGGTMDDTLSIRPNKTDPQGLGSALTYLRRYSLAAMCGIAPEDDDGNAASSVKPSSRNAQMQPAPAQTTSSQSKKDGTWETVLAKFADAKTVDDLDKRYHWFLDNDKIPRGWKDSYDEEYEKRRDALMEEAARTFDPEEVVAAAE